MPTLGIITEESGYQRSFSCPPLKEVRFGRDAGRMRVEPGGGREDEVALVTVSAGLIGVSGYHARIFLKDGRFILESLGRNGTFLNGHRLAEHALAELRGGDRVQFGHGGPVYRLAGLDAGQPAPTVDIPGPADAVPGPHPGRSGELLRQVVVRLSGAGSVAPGRTTLELARNLLSRAAEERLGPRMLALYVILALLVVAIGALFLHFQQAERKIQSQLNALHRTEEIIRARQDALEQTRDLTQEQIAALREGLQKHRRQPAPVPKPQPKTQAGRGLAASVFQVGLRLQAGGESVCSGMGTAFAVSRSVLVTNAHVARMIRETADAARLAENVSLSGCARQSGSQEVCVFALDDLRPAGTYRGDARGVASFYDDIAAVKTSCPGLKPLVLASPEALRSAPNGTPLWLIGFPGLVARYARSRDASVTQGVLVQRDERIIIHTAPTTGGASGGPMVDDQGRVVGINAGRFWDPDEREVQYGAGVASPAISRFLRKEELAP